MKKLILTSVACTLALAPVSRAEETGSGHYMPGQVASFIDAFPGNPGGFALVNFFTYYKGSTKGSQALPLHGNLTLGVEATIYADTVAGMYQTPWNVLGGGLAMGMGVPYVFLEVEGQAQRIGPGGVLAPPRNVRDTANGIGDMILYPYLLGWTNLMTDLKLDTRLAITAPTGDYDKGELDNIGKNYWTFEPGIMASWVSSKIGTELSLYSGIAFNTRNSDTDYQSGSSLHLDGTIAQHLPLGKGIVGIGANGYYYQQLSGDSGSGALLGDFKGSTVGVGPVLSYVRHVSKKSLLLAEIKWLPELDVEKRMKGDYIWLKLGITF